METSALLEEIRDLNLGYLMLAQRMIRQDKAAAVYRLGISQPLADVLADLTTGQVLKMAATSVMLCRMRLDDRVILGLLTSHGRDGLMQPSHVWRRSSSTSVPGFRCWRPKPG